MDKVVLTEFIDTCFDAVQESKVIDQTMKDTIFLTLITNLSKVTIIDPPFVSKTKTL